MKKELRQIVYDSCLGMCYYCGNELAIDSSWHVEHQTPRCHDGSNSIFNLVAACRDCNSRKGSKDLDEYREYLAKVLLTKIREALQFSKLVTSSYDAESDVSKLLSEAEHILSTRMDFVEFRGGSRQEDEEQLYERWISLGGKRDECVDENIEFVTSDCKEVLTIQ